MHFFLGFVQELLCVSNESLKWAQFYFYFISTSSQRHLLPKVKNVCDLGTQRQAAGYDMTKKKTVSRKDNTKE